MFVVNLTCRLQKNDYFMGLKYGVILILFNTFGLESPFVTVCFVCSFR